MHSIIENSVERKTPDDKFGVFQFYTVAQEMDFTITNLALTVICVPL